MKNLRVMGSTIHKEALGQGVPLDDLSSAIGCTAAQMQSIVKWRLLCSLQQVNTLAGIPSLTVNALTGHSFLCPVFISKKARTCLMSSVS